jgi:hypothetical protein
MGLYDRGVHGYESTALRVSKSLAVGMWGFPDVFQKFPPLPYYYSIISDAIKSTYLFVHTSGESSHNLYKMRVIDRGSALFPFEAIGSNPVMTRG